MIALSRLYICLLCCAMLAGAQPKWASEAEYELHREAQLEANPEHRLYLVERWRLAYPQSEFKEEQLRLKLAANRTLGRHEDVLATAVELMKMNSGDAAALNAIVVNGPKLQSPTGEQIEIVFAAANAVLAPTPAPAPELVLLNGAPRKVLPSGEAHRPPPVPPVTVESESPEAQAVTSMISDWRRNYRPLPDPAVQRKKDAEFALEWVKKVRQP